MAAPCSDTIIPAHYGERDSVWETLPSQESSCRHSQTTLHHFITLLLNPDNHSSGLHFDFYFFIGRLLYKWNYRAFSLWGLDFSIQNNSLQIYPHYMCIGNPLFSLQSYLLWYGSATICVFLILSSLRILWESCCENLSIDSCVNMCFNFSGIMPRNAMTKQHLECMFSSVWLPLRNCQTISRV